MSLNVPSGISDTTFRPVQRPPDPEDIRVAWRPETSVDVSMLFSVIAGLSDPFREALVAVDVVGLSYREAARALRVREATITTRLHRARQRVARALTQEPSERLS